jgi:hypothetical protein
VAPSSEISVAQARLSPLARSINQRVVARFNLDDWPFKAEHTPFVLTASDRASLFRFEKDRKRSGVSNPGGYRTLALVGSDGELWLERYCCARTEVFIGKVPLDNGVFISTHPVGATTVGGIRLGSTEDEVERKFGRQLPRNNRLRYLGDEEVPSSGSACGTSYEFFLTGGRVSAMDINDAC